MKRLITLTLFVCACGGGEPYTWQDANQAMAEAICEKGVLCGQYEASRKQECITAVVAGTCDTTCPDTLPDQTQVEQCIDDTVAAACDQFTSATPESCRSI